MMAEMRIDEVNMIMESVLDHAGEGPGPTPNYDSERSLLVNLDSKDTSTCSRAWALGTPLYSRARIAALARAA